MKTLQLRTSSQVIKSSLIKFFKKERCSDGATKKLKFCFVTATSACYDQSHGQVRQERLLDEVQNVGVQRVDWQPSRPPLLS